MQKYFPLGKLFLSTSEHREGSLCKFKIEISGQGEHICITWNRELISIMVKEFQTVRRPKSNENIGAISRYLYFYLYK